MSKKYCTQHHAITHCQKFDKNGENKEVFRSPYPILGCEFEPRDEQVIYCLKTDVIQGENGQYRPEPFLSVINLKEGTDFPLLALPNSENVMLSMSPDGVALLFDQVVTTSPQSSTDLLTTEKQLEKELNNLHI